MQRKRNKFIFVIILFIIAILPLSACSSSTTNNGNIYKTIFATQCDSLIRANATNPNFVILDVRTPSVWAADHLLGSICRNYYDADFNDQLGALPRNKIYLLHCQSGGRSAGAFNTMKSLGFAEVYEMSGGISAWKNSLLPTTSEIAPKLMSNIVEILKKETIQNGIADTLTITLTNRANDTLRFNSIILPSGNEFSTNFDATKKLKGADDYVFSIYYQPKQVFHDSVSIEIASNGGNISFSIPIANGVTQNLRTLVNNKITIFPNPSNSIIYFENTSQLSIYEVLIQSFNGQILKKIESTSCLKSVDISNLTKGIYIVSIGTNQGTFLSKLIKN